MWAAGQAVRSRRASGADAQLMSGSNECVRGSILMVSLAHRQSLLLKFPFYIPAAAGNESANSLRSWVCSARVEAARAWGGSVQQIRLL